MSYNRRIHLRTYCILGFIFTSALGVLLHFTFDWSKQNRIVAFFSPVNESTWEHLKLLAFPYLIYSILEYLKIGQIYDNYIIAKALGLLAGMLSIVMLFYTYTGIIGKGHVIADSVVFFLSVIIAFAVSSLILNHHLFRASIFQPIGVIIILAIVIAFMWFTFFPPKIHLFIDTVTKRYGIAMK
ncbi:MAG: DUF6512 family protein [Clostridiales bacterium]|nr:DUF6512 family protein [Clostridiales bacterium]